MGKTIIFILAATLLLSGCTNKTEYGDCIGILDEKKPDKTYKVSVWNVFLAVVFSEMIAPPILVLASETHCPVGNK